MTPGVKMSGGNLSETKFSVSIDVGDPDTFLDDEPLVEEPGAALSFRDAPSWYCDDDLSDQEKGCYIPITASTRRPAHLSCYFDSYAVFAPMYHLSAALVAQFTNTDVYCVVALDEDSGIPQAFLERLQNNSLIDCERVVKAFLDGETDLMNHWDQTKSSNFDVPISARRAISKGICLRKDLPEMLMPHLMRHYRVIIEQCENKLATELIITSCTYDDPPLALFRKFESMRQSVKANIDDQNAARNAVMLALQAKRKGRKKAKQDLREATFTLADLRKFWGMTYNSLRKEPYYGGPRYETLQSLCDHLDLDSTGRKNELASRLYRYFQRVDLRSRFPTDGGLRPPHWSWPGADLTLAKRATLAAAEAREEQRYAAVALSRVFAPTLHLPWEAARTIVSYCWARGAAKANEAEEAAAEPVAEPVAESIAELDPEAKKRARLLRARALILKGRFRP